MLKLFRSIIKPFICPEVSLFMSFCFLLDAYRDSKVVEKQQRETQSTERLSSSTLSTACKSVQVNGAATVSDLITSLFLNDPVCI